MQTTSLRDRMLRYELSFSQHLPRRIPMIARVDGKNFHSEIKTICGSKRGYHESFSSKMAETAKWVCEQTQGIKLAYCQSDEISFLFTDYDNLETQAWFDYSVSKINSVLASLVAAKLSTLFNHPLAFDCRCMSIPDDDVTNYFVYRQKDAIRNAISMVGQANFSHKELHKKSSLDIKKMLLDKGIDFDSLLVCQQRGFCWNKFARIDFDIPVFSENREYIERFIRRNEDGEEKEG